MKHNVNDHPDVIARPPRIFLAFIALSVVLYVEWPLQILSVTGSLGNLSIKLLGGLVLLAGIVVLVSAMREFKRLNTNIETWKAARTVVSHGIYRYSRNPIYLAMFVMLLGISLLANNLWMLFSYVPVSLIMYYGVIRKEETYLERKFGESYLRYKNNVSRWISLKKCS